MSGARVAAFDEMNTFLGLSRAIIGGAFFLAPGLTANRMIGIRDLALGLGILRAKHEDEQRRWLLACALVDAGDAIATTRSRLPFKHALLTLEIAGMVSELFAAKPSQDLV